MSKNQIICGDCLKVLPKLPKARMAFMDPPDNLGVDYDGFKDKRTDTAYKNWLWEAMAEGLNHSDVFWLSCYYLYQGDVWKLYYGCCPPNWTCRMFIWRFTFGQHRDTDCGNGYRPLYRFGRGKQAWNTSDIRVESQRQRNGDKRASENGRVPDDVWQFSRVCGNFPERRRWHPNQHPESLIERVVLMSTKPGDLVLDLCAGTGTVNRVCKRLDRQCIGIDISETYCRKIAEENQIDLLVNEPPTRNGQMPLFGETP